MRRAPRQWPTPETRWASSQPPLDDIRQTKLDDFGCLTDGREMFLPSILQPPLTLVRLRSTSLSAARLLGSPARCALARCSWEAIPIDQSQSRTTFLWALWAGSRDPGIVHVVPTFVHADVRRSVNSPTDLRAAYAPIPCLVRNRLTLSRALDTKVTPMPDLPKDSRVKRSIRWLV